MDGRQLISSGSPYELTVGYSRAVRVADRVVVAGTAPQWPDGAVDPDPATQARRCFEIIAQGLEGAGASLDDVVRTRTLLTRIADWEAVAAVRKEFVGHVKPVDTIMQVDGFVDPDWLVETEVDAVVSEEVAPHPSPTA